MLSVLTSLDARDHESVASLERVYAHHRQLPPLLRAHCFFGTLPAGDSCLGAQQQQPDASLWATERSSRGALACLLERVSQRTAALVAAWQAAGFTHGVLNTDNVSLFGLTLVYRMLWPRMLCVCARIILDNTPCT